MKLRLFLEKVEYKEVYLNIFVYSILIAGVATPDPVDAPPKAGFNVRYSVASNQ